MKYKYVIRFQRLNKYDSQPFYKIVKQYSNPIAHFFFGRKIDEYLSNRQAALLVFELNKLEGIE